MSRRTGGLLALVGALVASPALACSICGGNSQTAQTIRQRAGQAKVILYGSLVNPKLDANGGGTTELKIDRKLRTDAALGDQASVIIPRYFPGDPKDPPKTVVFFDVVKGKLDYYDGVAVRSPVLVEYLKGALDLDDKDRTLSLKYYFRYLDSADETVATDAYLELAKAKDAEVGQVAKHLDPEKLKKLIDDPRTQSNRIGLFAFFLGACGGDAEADLLRKMVEKPTSRTAVATDGALAGYIQLRPKEGWDLAVSLLKDTNRPFTERYAALGTVRFYHGWKGKDADREVLRCLGVVLEQGDIADVAIEDLRNWKLWDLTSEVLAQHGKKTHDAPLMRRALVRYALSCAKEDSKFRDQAARFVEARRRQDAELVKDVEESLQFERMK